MGPHYYAYVCHLFFAFRLEQVYWVAVEATVVRCKTVRVSAKESKTFEMRINSGEQSSFATS
jgi:hypothetical protein